MPRWLNCVLRLFGVPWLGHGRGTEFCLFAVAALYTAILLVLPNAAEHSQATRELFWSGNARLLVAPMASAATLSGYGLLANIRGLPFEQAARFAGAGVGLVIWVWFVTSFILAHAIATPGCVFSFIAVWTSVRIMILALAGLPPPAAPGNMS